LYKSKPDVIAAFRERGLRRREDGENHFPRNVYPKNYKRLEAQVGPLKTYAVELRMEKYG
jgi:hypothetical protein